jgi:hypothetical protein
LAVRGEVKFGLVKCEIRVNYDTLRTVRKCNSD